MSDGRNVPRWLGPVDAHAADTRGRSDAKRKPQPGRLGASVKGV
jgi:hypothetical protein